MYLYDYYYYCYCCCYHSYYYYFFFYYDDYDLGDCNANSNGHNSDRGYTSYYVGNWFAGDPTYLFCCS